MPMQLDLQSGAFLLSWTLRAPQRALQLCPAPASIYGELRGVEWIYGPDYISKSSVHAHLIDFQLTSRCRMDQSSGLHLEVECSRSDKWIFFFSLDFQYRKQQEIMDRMPKVESRRQQRPAASIFDESSARDAKVEQIGRPWPRFLLFVAQQLAQPVLQLPVPPVV